MRAFVSRVLIIQPQNNALTYSGQPCCVFTFLLFGVNIAIADLFENTLSGTFWLSLLPYFISISDILRYRSSVTFFSFKWLGWEAWRQKNLSL